MTEGSTIRSDDPSALALAVDAVRADLLVAVPTETVYGLACALTDAAVDRLLEAKGRDAGKGITLLVDDLADAASLIVESPVATRLAGLFWPGPLTLVMPLRTDATLPYGVTGASRSVGLRVPDQPFTRSLARALGPLPLTSANRSGEPEARDAAAVREAVGEAVELIIDGGPAPGGVPSTVVVLEPDGSWHVLRAGPISDTDLAKALQP
ncbi:MAG TPA: L-threonylcarbamoyladenylate synthase [Candidatus Baltobacteraceae bacterium]|nr:L-threonylcarbamoyladenylate synthase [Candidatus Baltobacteraceae bacterium]